MSRTREKGESFDSQNPWVGSFSQVQDCISYFPTQRTRRVNDPTSIGTYMKYSDKETMNDESTTPSRFNGCGHVVDYPVVTTFALPRCVTELPDADLRPNEWTTVGNLGNGNADAKYSVLSHMPSGEWGSFPAINWSSLVTEVGARLDGTMEASANVLVCLGELTKTLGMLKNPFGLLTTNWRRSTKTLRQLTKAGANVWLEYKYGWKNFFMDFDNITKSYEEAQAHVKYLLASRGANTSIAKRQSDVVTCSVPVPRIGTPYNDVDATLVSMTARRDACFSLDILRGAHFRVLSNMAYVHQRVGGGDVAAALWDLVPFSFVVDWFVDVQSMLLKNLAFSGIHNLRKVGYSISTRYYADLMFSSTAYGYGGDSVQKVHTIRNALVRKTYQRIGGFPPSTESAGLFGGLNLTHLLDAGALIAQRR